MRDVRSIALHAVGPLAIFLMLTIVVEALMETVSRPDAQSGRQSTALYNTCQASISRGGRDRSQTASAVEDGIDPGRPDVSQGHLAIFPYPSPAQLYGGCSTATAAVTARSIAIGNVCPVTRPAAESAARAYTPIGRV